MEARIGRGSYHFLTGGSSQGLGKNPQEWDLNDWKWDGDLFVATPMHPGPTESRKTKLFTDIVPSNGISSCSVQEFGIGREGLGKVDKRRRVVVVGEDEQCYEAGSLTLKLGGYDYPVIEGDNVSGTNRNGNSMVHTSNSNYPKCQVADCVTDLSQSKDYHRRHKVCEMHAKASSALVGNVMQRFCQQCSRFHLLQEFDEGKRSCRRRLLGHNKRRRKTNSNAPLSETLTTGDQTISHLLRIVTNLTSDRSERSKDQEILAIF
ncbi:hypothetical protein HPP92_002339 [Vanilla planifolia]|uniref:SBP-type domain-containing protein n=1 Tax=Vanilla planifolia TaxID=51239 RepID=A0A835VKI5_VANPL|nr:hypothetical protein HPP92_002339 [Vanilla planifolia]